MKIINLTIVILIVITSVVFAKEENQGMRHRFHMELLQEGPFKDEVFGAVSKDGFNFEILPGPFFKRASVPDVVELTKDSNAGERGALLLYFVDFSEVKTPGTEGISVAKSVDGINWSEKQRVIIEGKVNRGAAVDPSLVELLDGRIRMFFFGSEQTEGDPAKAEGDHKIYSAISEDGINFKAEPGVRFQAPFITDPEVLQVGNKKWLMFLSKGQETLLASSNDGLEFTAEDSFSLEIGGVPGAVELPDDSIRIFATGKDGIVSAVFTPNSNSSPIIEDAERISRGDSGVVADPACIKRLDGTYYLIFKKKPGRMRPKPSQE